MSQTRRVLIVENRSEWRAILDELKSRADVFRPFELHAVQTYGEALSALENQSYDVAVVDLTMRSTDHDYDHDGTHDGLQVLSDMAKRFPGIRLFVIARVLSPETLRNTPGLPNALTLFTRLEWDSESLRQALIDALRNGEYEDDGDDSPARKKRITSQLTRSGMTGPLPSGLTPPGVGSRPGRPRILIADDNAHWQDRLAGLMEEDGYFWRISPNAEQARERLQLETFHLVLLDLVLGDYGVPLREGSGWQLLDYLVNTSPKTKLIVMSDSATSADVAKLFMGYPIKAFIDKRAFNEAELRTIVREQNAGPSLRIHMLGDFRVWRDGKLINDFGHDLAELAIKILLTRRGESVSAGELIDYLWPGANPNEKYPLLGGIINAARLALEPDQPRPNDSKFILRSGSNYQFNMINVEVDAEQLRQFVSEGRQHERRHETELALKSYRSGRELYKGDYLPGDRLARWAMQERSALQTLYTEALNRMADLYAVQGDLKKAIEVAQQAQQVDSYVESTYRRLMRYHACLGDKTAALAVYRRLEILFKEFFGEDPSTETTRLSSDIEGGKPVRCFEENMTAGD